MSIKRLLFRYFDLLLLLLLLLQQLLLLLLLLLVLLLLDGLDHDGIDVLGCTFDALRITGGMQAQLRCV